VLEWKSTISRYLEARPDALCGFLREQRWFAGKARSIAAVEVLDIVPMGESPRGPDMVLARVSYSDAEPQEYAMLLAAADEDLALPGSIPHFALTNGDRSSPLILYDALWNPLLMTQLLAGIDSGRTWRSRKGELTVERTRAFHQLRGPNQEALEPSILSAEQSNTSLRYGERLILKLFRRLQEGIHPEVEVGTFLTERTSFSHFAPVAAVLSYRRPGRAPITIAMLQAFVPNQGDAWCYTLGQLDRYLTSLAWQQGKGLEPAGLPGRTLIASSLLENYLDRARLLGRRTAELHLALSSGTDDPAFAPEPFTLSYQESLYRSVHDSATQMLSLLRSHRLHWTGRAREQAEWLLDRADRILERLRGLASRPIAGQRTRIHGDYHLGQVLCSGEDFVIIDFEGEPARPLEERRSKRSPAADIAGMLRSFHYAACTALRTHARHVPAEDALDPRLEAAARSWQKLASAAYLDAYLAVATPHDLLPSRREDLDALLAASLIEKAVYELSYELNHRPDWVDIPLQGLLQLAEAD
jgi:trehalose synthase-fused probable maltokinase